LIDIFSLAHLVGRTFFYIRVVLSGRISWILAKQVCQNCWQISS